MITSLNYFFNYIKKYPKIFNDNNNDLRKINNEENIFNKFNFISNLNDKICINNDTNISLINDIYDIEMEMILK